nr:hypothetical protein [Smaragdicoccus niigatensis]
MDDGGSPYAIPSEVARYGRTTVQRLAQDRYLQRGIPFIKDGRKVLYRWDDVRNHYDKLAKESA